MPGEIEIKPTWLLTFRFWWAFTWRLFSFNLLISGVYWLAYQWVGGHNETLDATLLAISAVLFLALEIWLMRTLLSRRFGPFRVAVFRVES